ncbi:transglutaminase domain-containing protein [Sphingobacterium spiritivorum]|uniref:transglutaminase domain-containing protein n=1 Tax=Sphingobacterium spiritivorum TaxID=258 RepID=UPI003DA4C141
MSKKNIIKYFILTTLFFIGQSCQNNEKVNFDKLIQKYSIDKKDSLKLQCLMFIKENMGDIKSEIPVFYNENGTKIDFRLDTITSENSLNKILINKKIVFSSNVIKDSDFLPTNLLEENIDKAISDWQKYPWNKNVPKDVFFNYLLPYKILNEKPDNWRFRLFQKYKDSILNYQLKDENDGGKLYMTLRNEAWSWLEYTGNFTRLTRSPSSSELLAIKKGECFELSHLMVYIARSAGIPATIDIVPMWGKTNGSHASEVFYGPIKEKDKIKGYGFHPPDVFKFPAKVFRISFKKTNLWTDSIKPVMNNKNYYLPNFLKSDHMLDVTHEHTQTLDLVYKFEKAQDKTFAYICVSSYGKWKPIFYGNITSNGEYANFKNMAADIAYHIAVPDGSGFKLVGKPFILDSLNNITYSSPDFRKTVNIHTKRINIGEKSWVKRNRKYTLKFLNQNNVWQELSTKSCQADSILNFSDVPSGAFLILEEKESKKRLARMFLYKNGKQIWY